MSIYKIKSIAEFPQPTTQKQLLKFLGMLNFYRKCLPNLNIPNKINYSDVIANVGA